VRVPLSRQLPLFICVETKLKHDKMLNSNELEHILALETQKRVARVCAQVYNMRVSVSQAVCKSLVSMNGNLIDFFYV
jgi:hypothetical protein